MTTLMRRFAQPTQEAVEPTWGESFKKQSSARCCLALTTSPTPSLLAEEDIDEDSDDDVQGSYVLTPPPGSCYDSYYDSDSDAGSSESCG